MSSNRIQSEFPCVLCPHSAWQHYESIASGKAICLFCYNEKVTPGSSDYKYDPVHDFVPDNLKYLEMKEKEKASWQGQPGITFSHVIIDEGVPND